MGKEFCNKKHICERCGTEFKQKSHYTNHINRKNPCKDKNEDIKNIINTLVEKKVSQLVPQYSELSKHITSILTKEQKKEKGIYFSPFNIIKKTCDTISEYSCINNLSIKDILEPSCGSCEIIKYINNIYNNVNIDGIEYDNTIFDNIKDIKFGNNNNINLLNMDYLNYNITKKYDLIITNPPYFIIKKEEVDKKYYEYFEGRPNIFVLFIVHSLFKLNENGILAFILPKSFCNCLYYNKLRLFINNNYKIIDVIDCSNEKYLETEQDTIILIIQNTKNINNENYIYKNDNILLINTKENINKINNLLKDSTTLEKLNFNVKVGEIVWNQCKDILTDDDTKTRLIYSSDIKDSKLTMKKYKNDSKKNFIDLDGISGPVIVVNRGYGTGKYDFNFCMLDYDDNYLIENHLIMIKYDIESCNLMDKYGYYKIKELNEILDSMPNINSKGGGTKLKKINKIIDNGGESLLVLNDIKEKYEQIINSFKNIKTQQFIELYCCNSAMNCTELQKVLPIYL